MSQLLRRACEEAKTAGSDIRAQVRAVGNKFTRHSEVSAQEAVYLTLQMPLRRSSRSFIFINASPPEERPFILKDEELLKTLPDDSTDIQCANLFSRYIERPKHMEDMCLAHFAVWYDRIQQTATKPVKPVPDPRESDMEDNLDDDEYQCQSDIEKGRVKLRSGTMMRLRRHDKVARYVKYNKKTDPENHYRELLLLFHPWRDESKIRGDRDTYEDRYNDLTDEVEEVRAHFEHHSEELDMAEQMLENTEDSDERYDQVAPATQHVDMQDGNEENREDGQLFTEYDIGQDLGLSSRDAQGSDTAEELIRNRISDEQFRKDVRSLNVKQREIFDHILFNIKTNPEQMFLFLSGGAGVGKSRVTKCVYQALIRHFNTTAGDNPEQLNILLTAPTGKAAYLIGGTTIHPAFSVPANQNLVYKPLTSEKLNTLRTKMVGLKVLFIDEISMCGSNLFSFIDFRLQEIKQRSAPFGGVHLICVGDLFQLHPVMDRWIFQYPGRVDDLSVLAPHVWLDRMQLFELTEIMRQAGDVPFAEALNNIREGNHTNSNINLIKSRIITEEDHATKLDSTHILYYNKAVSDHNTKAFNACQGQKIQNTAKDVVIGDVQPQVKVKILQSAPVRPGDAMGLPKVYQTAVGLRNELTVNLDIVDGLVNGAVGTTKAISYLDVNQTVPSIIWILFDDVTIGSERRRNFRNIYSADLDNLWTPIAPIARQFTVGKYKNAKIQRTQFPLQLACAKTVHRSQGVTLAEIVVQLPNEKRPHIHYVALSRVSSLTGLNILEPFDSSKVTVSPDVKGEMERLRQSCQLRLYNEPFNEVDRHALTVCFQNAQSVKLHFGDIIANAYFHKCDILMFAESKLCKADGHLHIDGYYEHRHDFSPTRSPYGIVIYTKISSIESTSRNVSRNGLEIIMLSISKPYELDILCVYCRPNESFTNI